MTRAELETKLNNDFAWMLETWAAFSPEDRTRDLKASSADPEFLWNAQDHLVHLAGIESVFNNIIRRQAAGEPNPIQLFDAKHDGSRPSREEIMARVHQMNDDWIRKHRGKSFNEVVVLSQKVRAETLALLAELSDEQLQQKIPGAPWADGTVGGVMGVNGDHARQHHGWIMRDLAN
ncbi:MAG: DinB family protein [Blastocatellia bacterium]